MISHATGLEKWGVCLCLACTSHLFIHQAQAWLCLLSFLAFALSNIHLSDMLTWTVFCLGYFWPNGWSHPKHRRFVVSSASNRFWLLRCPQDDLPRPTHPIRLGLALNFSVFYYEARMWMLILGPSGTNKTPDPNETFQKLFIIPNRQSFWYIQRQETSEIFRCCAWNRFTNTLTRRVSWQRQGPQDICCFAMSLQRTEKHWKKPLKKSL